MSAKLKTISVVVFEPVPEGENCVGGFDWRWKPEDAEKDYAYRVAKGKGNTIKLFHGVEIPPSLRRNNAETREKITKALDGFDRKRVKLSVWEWDRKPDKEATP